MQLENCVKSRFYALNCDRDTGSTPVPGKSSPEILFLAFGATNRQDRQNLTVVKLVLVDRKATKIGNQSDRPLGSPRRRKNKGIDDTSRRRESSKYHIQKHKNLFSMQRNHRKPGSSSNFYKSKVSKLYKGKGHITTEPTSFSELQNQQFPKVKTGLTNPCNNIGRPLSDSRQLTTSFSTQ